MSRYDPIYSEADMLDAFYAGKQFGIDALAKQLQIGEPKNTDDSFSTWIEKRNKDKQDAKELKDDEMRAEAQADGEQYERELEESNQI